MQEKYTKEKSMDENQLQILKNNVELAEMCIQNIKNLMELIKNPLSAPEET